MKPLKRIIPVAALLVLLFDITPLAHAQAERVGDKEESSSTTYDAETFFDVENVYATRIRPFSHDENWILAESDRNGTFNVYAIPVGGGEAKQLTHAEDGEVFAVSWFPEDDRFLYEGDEGGDERYSLYVRELDGTATDLTPADDVRADFLDWSADGSAFWVSTNERAGRVMDLYRYATDGYDRELVFRNDDDYLIDDVSPDGRWVALRQINSNIDIDLYLHDLHTGQTVTMSPDEEGVVHRFLAFSPTLEATYYSTDGIGEFVQAWRYDLATGERTVAEVSDWDVRRLQLSPRGTYRVARINEDSSPTTRVTHVATEQPFALPTFPAGEVVDVTFSPSETKLLISVMGSRTPVDLFTLDLADPDAVPQRLTRSLSPLIDPDDLVEAEMVRFGSYDGLEIPSVLYRPKQASAERHTPALIYVHSGPGGQSFRAWDERIQHLVNHGYAVFAINNRGSGGYGRTFKRLDDRRHGEADLGDVVAAREWLAGLDWVDGARIGILGDSYGGYMTLAVLALQPEVFEVGIAMHPPINWISTLTIAYDRVGAGVEAQYAELGHPERDAERLARISPFFHADRIVDPVLIMQGANDRRYDFEEIDQFVAKLESNGVPVEYTVFKDEGHVLRNRDNRVMAQEAWLEFLDRHLR